MATFGELFAGIGGLSKALEMMGHEPRWFAEWDKDAAKELARKYPGVPIYGDVTEIDYSKVEPVDILAGGGWPCQGFSGAGKRLGIDDPRYQWPQVMRALRCLRPRVFLFEQVADILRPWPVYDGTGEDKRLLGYRHPPIARVLADLSAAGYMGRYGCLRASDVGAPHGRRRLFLVAHREGAGLKGEPGTAGGRDQLQRPQRLQPVGLRQRAVPDPNGIGRVERELKSSQQKPGSSHSLALPDAIALLATPTAHNAKGRPGGGIPSVISSETLNLLPSPTTRDANGAKDAPNRSGGPSLVQAIDSIGGSETRTTAPPSEDGKP